MTPLQEAHSLAASGHRPEAITLLESALREEPAHEEAWLYLGELIYAEGRMAEALNKFNTVLRLNPANRQAANYVRMINGILGYYCKDMFNP